MATEFVIRNTQERPDKAGVVRPYLTRTFNGRQYPVTFTEQQIEKWGEGLPGEPQPVPDGMETVPVNARDTHDLLERLIREQKLTREMLALIAEQVAEGTHALRPKPRLSRWQRFRFWLHLRLHRR